MIRVAYIHGLRVSELIALQWSQVDWSNVTMHINRLKSGNQATHPLYGDELRLLRRLKRDHPESTLMFVSETGGALCRSSFSRIVARAGKIACIPFPVHPHMLRHATGYYLANAGIPTRTIQAYLGHKSIQHTVRYTALSPEAFVGLFRNDCGSKSGK